jgi:2-oxoglutarate dehydrogenase E2 component (dihydrolipoamide succinyltransferase)
MPTDVIMPQMGESIFEGTITKWLKKAGDTVEKDEPLFEISTDKVDAEIPSPTAGVLIEIKVPVGATVQVNTVVAVVAESGEVVAAPAQNAAALSIDATAGGTDVVMPQMGESIFEGTITKWLKNVGDRVEKDETLFEISTDKVDAEIPSPEAGVLTQIKVPVGATVQVNTVVAVIGGSGASGASVANLPVPLAKPVAPASESAPTSVSVNADGQLRSSPLVRRIAKENSLNLSQIAGTGSNGRITKDDILKHLSQHGAGSASTATLAPPQVVPMSKMRAIIAQRMVESVRTSPHAYTVYKIDMTRIVKLRERQKATFEKKHGVKLTYMPFIAAAVVEAMGKFPIINASMGDGVIHYHPNVHLGIAVALDWGLIVPVVRGAETRDFVSLSRAIADLADRARSKKLLPDEASGSTFTLTNSGVFGGEFGTPILNQPESAILAIGGLKKEAVVLTDSEGNDAIAIRSMQHYCLGFDHRTIDGGEAGKFMSEFKKTLETFTFGERWVID